MNKNDPRRISILSAIIGFVSLIAVGWIVAPVGTSTQDIWIPPSAWWDTPRLVTDPKTISRMLSSALHVDIARYKKDFSHNDIQKVYVYQDTISGNPIILYIAMEGRIPVYTREMIQPPQSSLFWFKIFKLTRVSSVEVNEHSVVMKTKRNLPALVIQEICAGLALYALVGVAWILFRITRVGVHLWRAPRQRLA